MKSRRKRRIERWSACAALVGVVFSVASCTTVRPESGAQPIAAPPAPGPHWTSFATSSEGRPLEFTRTGSGAKRMLVIGSIHGNETEGLSAIDEAWSCAHDNRREWTTTIVRDMNPDGTAKRTRANARGVDLNRNWPARNFRAGKGRGAKPLSEPETAAVHALLVREQPDVIVVFHSTSRGPFVNYDGPAEAHADAFAESVGWRVEADMGYATPGSLGSFAGDDRSIPILTIEFDRGERPDAGAVAKSLAAVYRERATGVSEAAVRPSYRRPVSAGIVEE